jgi:hypothetical protein
VYGDYVDTFPEDGALPDGVTTRHGKHIAADLYLSTRGGRPNTAVLASSGFTLNEHGQVPVELTFLAKGHKNVFAVGDITDIKEQKQCAKYGGHVSVVTANILSVLEKREPSKKYGGSPEILVLTNGKVCSPSCSVLSTPVRLTCYPERRSSILLVPRRNDDGCLVRKIHQSQGLDDRLPSQGHGLLRMISSPMLR